MTATTAQKNTGKKQAKGAKPPLSDIRREVGKETQFAPGQSGNPAGRPKGSLNYKTIAVEAWDEIAEEQAEAYNKKYAASIKAGQRPAKTAADFPIPKLLIKKHTIMALAGSERSLDSVQDRFFGKAVVTIAGDPENPIEHSIESKKERARRMLAMFNVPVIDDRSNDDEDDYDDAPQAVTTKPDKVPTQKPTRKPQKPAKQPVKKNLTPPGRKAVSRTPLPNRYTRK